ncbi:hypothetical protein [Selenomonas sp. AB3002]|uniref:hypothetical protein n=1 Tax=Selenomonas sp. AB3002 TaxID=1392502 RepID=UPI000496866B
MNEESGGKMKAYRIIVLIMLIISAVIGTCFASDAYNNNPNYKEVFPVVVTNNFYFDKSSVKVHRYEPPIYEIQFEVVCYDRLDQSKNKRNYYDVRCNYETKSTLFRKEDNEYYTHNAYQSGGTLANIVVDEAFKVAYGIPFYKQIENGRIALCNISPLHGSYDKIVNQRFSELNFVGNLELIDIITGMKMWYYHDKIRGIGLQFKKDDSLSAIMTNMGGYHGGEIMPDGIRIGSRGEDIIDKYGSISLDTPPTDKADYHYSSPDGCHMWLSTKNNKVIQIFLFWQEP